MRSFWPVSNLIKTCEADGLRVVINHQLGMGHLIAEADNFARMKHLGEIDPKLNYGLLHKPNEHHIGLMNCFGGLFNLWVLDERMPPTVQELTRRRSDLTVDIGVSDWKIYPKEGIEFRLQKDRLEGKIPWPDTLDDMRAYWRRTYDSRYFKPWSGTVELADHFRAALGHKGEPIALIHLKPAAVNATAGITPPESYLPTLDMLKAKGFKLIFVGREKMPVEFDHLGMVNYAQSGWATVENDIRLFKNASFALISGSGLAHFADVFDVPYVYCNSWHSFLPQPSVLCVEVPAIIRECGTGFQMTLAEQAAVFGARDDFADWNFPGGRFTNRYEARLATDEEILSASEEALSLEFDTPMSDLQKSTMKVDPFGFRKYAGSRICQTFLQHHGWIIQ